MLKWFLGDNSQPTILISGLFLTSLFLTACGGSSGGGGGGGDVTPPQVIQPISPLANATNVPVASNISATFSEPVQTGSVTFLLNGPGGAISTSVPVLNAGKDSVTITPNAVLANNTTYVATISAAKDSAGNNIAAPFNWSFTTEPVNNAPTVSSHTPTVNATGVPVNTSISIVFSEAMDPATINATNITVSGGVMASSVSYSGVTAVFTPSADLANSTTYVVVVNSGGSGVKDATNIPMAANYIFSFTTASAPDLTPPTVSSTTPVINATGVTLNSAIIATFSEAMNPASISETTFSLKETVSATPVTGTVSYNGVTATFTPDSVLRGTTQYTATLAGGVGNIEDQSGNVLVTNYSWSFTTGPSPDTTPPYVSSTVPVDTGTTVGTNTAITALFSEPVDPGTVNSSNFTVYDNTNTSSVAGSITYNGLTASFTPIANLANSSLHTATLSGVKDIAGNPMALTSWTFTTAAAPDVTAPSVVLPTTPADMATNVDISTSISAEFDEPMDAATLGTGTFTVFDMTNTAPVAGVLTYNGVTASFLPSSNLAFSALISVTIDGATDLAGNPLPLTNWTFTTSAMPDTTGPQITATNPVNLATDVIVRPTITVTFNEAIDCSTLLDSSLVLTGGSPVSFISTCSTDVATFIPTTDLARNTVYTATLSSTVTDIAGNTLVANAFNPWMFTTVPKLWTVQSGSTSHDQVGAVVTDSVGNVYITGSTLGDMDGQVNSGGNDIYLAKFTPEGVRVWTRMLGSTQTDIGQSAVVDSADNIYVAGYSRGDLGGNLNNNNTKDIAIVKFNSDGVLQWTKLFGTNADDVANSVTVDGADNVYLTGTTYGNFDGASAMRNGSELFVLKLDSTGTEQWRTQLGSDVDIVSQSIATDSTSVFVTGYASGNIQEPVLVTNNGSTDILLAKFSAATGTLEISKLYGSSTDNRGYGIATDGTNLYFIGNTQLGFNGETPVGDLDAFLMQTDLFGVVQWTRIFGTTLADRGRGVVMDASGDVYVTGYTSGSFTGAVNAGSNDIFVTKYNNLGNTVWVGPVVKQLGSAADDSALAIASYNVGMAVDIFVAGETLGAFDGNPALGLYDYFIVNYDGVTGLKN